MSCTYEAFFNRQRTTIEAEGRYAAKQKAVAHFKPRRSQEHMVSVVLVHNGDAPVALNNNNADFG